MWLLVKHEFTDAMLNNTRLAPNISKMFQLCFPTCFTTIKNSIFPCLVYAAVTSVCIYIYYLTTIQTAITIELHVFLKGQYRPLRIKHED